MGRIASPTSPITASAEGFARSSVGRKQFMAVTGTILLLFVIGHMLGNLQVFLGQEALNTYAVKLRDLAVVVWVVRVIMLMSILVHILYGIILWFENRVARPIGYRVKATVQAPLSSRTMIYTGLGILLYAVYHLLQFTFIVTNPEYENLKDAAGRHDVYSMVVLGFQDYTISAVYIVAVALLAYHLSHGVNSLFQTLGLNNARAEVRLRRLAYGVAWVLFLGYASIPAAVLLEFVKLPAGGI